MKNAITLCLGVLLTLFATAQDKYMTRSAEIRFESNAEVDDDVRAVNNQVAVVFSPDNGKLGFQLLIKSFEFRKALMQEHFNENYMESDKYPKATFKGTVENISEVDFSDGKPHEVTVTGDMTIHGVTQNISEKATLQLNGDAFVITTHFKVPVADYNIEIPQVVSDKIADKIDVDVKAELSKK